MIKNVLIILLIAPLLFASCMKEYQQKPIFRIDGIRDVWFDATGGHILNLTIEQFLGDELEEVRLSVTGLPAGVNVTIDKPVGTPRFKTILTFSLSAIIPAGTYPIHIVGKSPSVTRNEDLNVVVPTLNGFIVDGLLYQITGMSDSTSGGSSVLTVISNVNGGAQLRAAVQGAFPAADGNYTYFLYPSLDPAKNMAISISSMSSQDSLTNTGSDNRTATLKVSSGSYSLSFPATLFSDGAITKVVTADIHQ